MVTKLRLIPRILSRMPRLAIHINVINPHQIINPKIITPENSKFINALVMPVNTETTKPTNKVKKKERTVLCRKIHTANPKKSDGYSHKRKIQDALSGEYRNSRSPILLI